MIMYSQREETEGYGMMDACEMVSGGECGPREEMRTFCRVESVRAGEEIDENLYSSACLGQIKVGQSLVPFHL